MNAHEARPGDAPDAKPSLFGGLARRVVRKVRNSDYVDALARDVRALASRLDRIERERRNGSPSGEAPAADSALLSMLASFIDPTFPWLTEYTHEITEEFVLENARHHAFFVELVEKYARRAAGERTPRLLDFGAGSGTLSIVFSQRNYDVVAIDNDPIMVARARRIAQRLGGYARILCMDGLDLPLMKEGSFDVAFSQGTLEHFDNDTIRKFLQAQLHVARFVVFSVPSFFWPHHDFGNERKMTLEEWRTILDDCGVRIDHLSYYQQDHWHVAAAVTRKE
ncbi:MAG TPA: class I SAM-dependent methyltransferase [Planctomycetota bacterium]|nr:class I SAM-dependent methyltransferase [Planctomycetota bacterium]